MPKHSALADFLTPKQIKKALELKTAKEIHALIIEPNIQAIANTGERFTW